MDECKVVLERIKIYDCKKCTRGFTKLLDLKYHKLEHVKHTVAKKRANDKLRKNNEYETNVECDSCGKRFVHKSTLTAHLALHKPYPHKCECGVGFYDAKDLGYHKTLVHPERYQKSNKIKSSTKENVNSKLKNNKYIGKR